MSSLSSRAEADFRLNLLRRAGNSPIGATRWYQALASKQKAAYTFERDYYKDLLPIRWETILVELEEGVLFISNPRDLTWKDVKFEMPVKLGFLDCEDSAGPFKLPIFDRA